MRKFYFISLSLLISLVTAAQVAVRDEPRHHSVFENEYIRILDVYIPPKDTTQFHVHNTPSVFISFTKTATGSQLIGGQPLKSISGAGDVWYDSLATTRIHRVWNEDTSWFHVMDIELTAGKPKNNPPLLQNTYTGLLFNQPLVNGYRLKFSAGTQLELPSSASGYLLLSTDETTIEYKTKESVQKRLMKAGHYIWIEAGRPATVTAVYRSASFLLLQVK